MHRKQLQDVRMKYTQPLKVPPIPCWIAELNLSDANQPIDEVTSAIQRCSCFLLILTKAASDSGSRAGDEWKLALRYKKAIVIAALGDWDLPPHLVRRSKIAIDPSDNATFEALRALILSTGTTEGLLATAQQYLTDAEWAKRYAHPDRIGRINEDIAAQKNLVQSLSDAVSDPGGIRNRLNERIRLGVELERIPHSAPDANATDIFINAPPVVVPAYFQDRELETRIICDFLCEEFEDFAQGCAQSQDHWPLADRENG
jgi:hypothetical protein